MNYSFYFFLSLVLIVFRCTLTLFLPWELNFYDPLLPLVIYVTLLRPVREAVMVCVALGLALDSMSGGAFGLYLTAYFWLMVVVRWVVNFLRMGSTAIFPIVVVLGVIMQNAIIMAIHAVSHRTWPLDDLAVRAISGQLLWALFTGPIFLMGIGFLHRKWVEWMARMFMFKNSGQV